MLLSFIALKHAPIYRAAVSTICITIVVFRRSAQRMNILLIATIATFVAWLAGLITKPRGQASIPAASRPGYKKILKVVLAELRSRLQTDWATKNP